VSTAWGRRRYSGIVFLPLTKLQIIHFPSSLLYTSMLQVIPQLLYPAGLNENFRMSLIFKTIPTQINKHALHIEPHPSDVFIYA